MLERIERVFTSARPLEVEDVITRAGADRHFRSVLFPVTDTAGNVVAVQVQSWESTSKHEAARSLSRVNTKLAVILENAPYLILTTDRAGHITYLNRVGPGFSMKDVLGSDSHGFVHADFHARYDAAIKTVFEDQPIRFEFRDVNGSWWVASMSPVKHEGVVEQLISFSIDITSQRLAEQEQARLQEQMRHAQKLESLGVLAGGIAHDFNNLLTVIAANTDLARAGADAGGREHLEAVTVASRRAAELCQQLLAYAGRGHFVSARLDLSSLVREMAQLVTVSVSKGARLDRELAADLPPIEADPAQLRQVVLNLITNASDAIGANQGVISISTRRERFDEVQLTETYLREGLRAGDFVVLEVKDTGAGMDEETRRRMFEPFYSTKGSGRGLGHPGHHSAAWRSALHRQHAGKRNARAGPLPGRRGRGRGRRSRPRARPDHRCARTRAGAGHRR